MDEKELVFIAETDKSLDAGVWSYTEYFKDKNEKIITKRHSRILGSGPWEHKFGEYHGIFNEDEIKRLARTAKGSLGIFDEGDFFFGSEKDKWVYRDKSKYNLLQFVKAYYDLDEHEKALDVLEQVLPLLKDARPEYQQRLIKHYIPEDYMAFVGLDGIETVPLERLQCNISSIS